MKFHRLWLLIGWLMVGIVIYGSLTPSPPQTPGFEHGDKLLHGLAYLVLMGWFGQLYGGPQRPWVALALVGMGAGLEWMQGLEAARTTSWADGLANTAGVAGGWLVLGTRLGRGLARLDKRLSRW